MPTRFIARFTAAAAASLLLAGSAISAPIYVDDFDTDQTNNASSSADPESRNLLFALFDNVVVSVVPEPASWSVLALPAALGLLRRKRRQ